MRFHCKAVAGVLIALAVVSVGVGQFGGGGGGGFGGGGGPTDPVALLNNQQVRKELGITDAQSDKIPDAVYDALAKVLDAKQVKRLREIQLQRMGTTRSLLDAKLQKDLKFTDSQKDSIKTISDDSTKELASMTKGGFGKGGDFKGMQEKIAAFRKEADEKLMNVLTADQRKAYKQALGEEFKFETPKGKGFGKKDTKKDAEE